MIIYTSQSSSVVDRGDFLSLSIVNGHAEFSFKLGKRMKPTIISSKFRIDDGNWHKIKVLRKRRIGILQIDKDKPVKTRSPKGGSVLNTDGIIWIGGKQGVPGNVPNRFLQGFDGCIRKVKIFRRKLDLFRQGGNSNLQQCSTN